MPQDFRVPPKNSRLPNPHGNGPGDGLRPGDFGRIVRGMNRIMLACLAVLTEGAVALGSTTGHAAVSDATTPTLGSRPVWLTGLLIGIAAMFVAAIVAGLIWRQPATEPSPVDDHGQEAHSAHH